MLHSRCLSSSQQDSHATYAALSHGTLYAVWLQLVPNSLSACSCLYSGGEGLVCMHLRQYHSSSHQENICSCLGYETKKMYDRELTCSELSHVLLSGTEVACLCCARYDIVLHR